MPISLESPPRTSPRAWAQEDLREQGGVTYRELRSRSLLNKCDSPRMPFTWTVNPYRGCAMGCRYCYAAYTHEFMGITTPEDFHSLVYVKTGAEEETARRLAAVVRRGERIALGTATDPYQPGEAEARVTRASWSWWRSTATCASASSPRARSSCATSTCCGGSTQRSRLSVHVSLITPHAELAPRAWSPGRRRPTCASR